MSEPVAVLLSDWKALDLYVARYLSWGMQREDFVRHIDSLHPHHKQEKDLLLHAWKKVTGESSATRRWRLPKEPPQRFFRLLNEETSRELYVQRYRPKKRKHILKYIKSRFPHTHHEDLRARLMQSWDHVRKAEAVPRALAGSAGNADQ